MAPNKREKKTHTQTTHPKPYATTKFGENKIIQARKIRAPTLPNQPN